MKEAAMQKQQKGTTKKTVTVADPLRPVRRMSADEAFTYVVGKHEELLTKLA